MSKSTKALSIIIINWNSVEYLKKCLHSIYSRTNNLDFEVIVVDNASYDGCDEFIKNEFPQAKFIQSKENIGFARANNLGYEYSSGRNLLFLNPDTEILDSAINIMYSYLESIPDAGAVGCKLLNSDLSVQTSCIQPFPTILNQALDVEYLKLKFPQLRLWGIKPLFFNDGNPEEVEVVSGACIMIKKDVFEEIDMFSTDYFMYSEDLDLCYKIQQSGYKSFYISNASVVHHGGGSTRFNNKNEFNIVLMRESVFKFLEKNRGTLNALLYKFSMALVSISRLLLISILIPIALLFGCNTLHPVFNKWKKVLKWSLGFEKWTRELTANR